MSAASYLRTGGPGVTRWAGRETGIVNLILLVVVSSCDFAPLPLISATCTLTPPPPSPDV